MTNENEVEETTETNDEELEELEEETEETSDEEELEEESEEDDSEDDDNDTPTLSDYEKLQKELKTLKAQKEHWRKKATAEPDKQKSKKANFNKLNKKDIDIEESMDVRFLKRDGFTDEDIEKLKVIKAGYAATGKDVSLIDAANDDLFKSIVEKKKLQEKKEKAQLGSSGKPLSHSNKKMSSEEFEKYRQNKSREFLKNMGFNS